MICPACAKPLPDHSRFCIQCGEPVTPLHKATRQPKTDDMNLPILYGMVAGLIAAVLFPPWETPPGQPPAFLGLHFILTPPAGGGMAQGDAGVISRLLLTIELVTIAVAGLYFAWLFRKK
jgi:hypothetical protein